MYVACAQTNKIIKATLDGKQFSSVDNKGLGNLEFSWPMGMCQDAACNIYVADCYNNRIQVLGPDCSYRMELKCKGRALGMTVNLDDEVHVATDFGIELLAR